MLDTFRPRPIKIKDPSTKYGGAYQLFRHIIPNQEQVGVCFRYKNIGIKLYWSYLELGLRDFSGKLHFGTPSRGKRIDTILNRSMDTKTLGVLSRHDREIRPRV